MTSASHLPCLLACIPSRRIFPGHFDREIPTGQRCSNAMCTRTVYCVCVAVWTGSQSMHYARYPDKSRDECNCTGARSITCMSYRAYIHPEDPPMIEHRCAGSTWRESKESASQMPHFAPPRAAHSFQHWHNSPSTRVGVSGETVADSHDSAAT